MAKYQIVTNGHRFAIQQWCCWGVWWWKRAEWRMVPPKRGFVNDFATLAAAKRGVARLKACDAPWVPVVEQGKDREA